MSELPTFRAGAPMETELGASKLNAIVDAVKAGRLQQGRGVRLAKSTSGTTISAVADRMPLQPPPFWPVLHVFDDGEGGETYKVSVERGSVIGKVISIGDVPENRAFWTPSNMLDGDGDPALFAINVGQSLYVVVSMDATGAITSVVLGVYPEGSPPAGTYGGADTVYSHKLCTLEAKTIGGYSTIQLTRWWSGGNIDLCGRNLDLCVHVYEMYSYVPKETSKHYLCWRFGDYVGKFDEGDTRPAAIGTLDTDDVDHWPNQPGAHLNLTVNKFGYVEDGTTTPQYYKIYPTDESTTHYWRYGYYVGTTTPTDPPGLVAITQTVVDLEYDY